MTGEGRVGKRFREGDRTHRTLFKDAPPGRVVDDEGAIVSEPVFGGLHRRYRRNRAFQGQQES